MISKHKGINPKFQSNFVWQGTFQALDQAAGNNPLLGYKIRKGEAWDTVRPQLWESQPGPSSKQSIIQTYLLIFFINILSNAEFAFTYCIMK